MRHYARPYIAHTSRRITRWLSFFAEYNFSVEYKPGRLNVVADALSRRPDFEPAVRSISGNSPTVSTLTTSVLLSTLMDDIKKAYTEDKDLLHLMDHLINPPKKSLKTFTGFISIVSRSVHVTQRLIVLHSRCRRHSTCRHSNSQ